MGRRRSARRRTPRFASRRSRRSRRAVRLVRLYTDPLQHAGIAAAVAAPLVPRVGGGALVTAVTAAVAIDVDHAVAARSVRVAALTSLPARPRTHSLAVALGTGATVAAAAGPVHGWAAFAGLASHLLHDAADDAAPTPVLWPFAPPARRLGRRRQAVGTAALLLGSIAVSRATARASRASTACAGAGGASARPRTA